MCSHLVLIPISVYKTPVNIIKAPATESAGVMTGRTGRTVRSPWAVLPTDGKLPLAIGATVKMAGFADVDVEKVSLVAAGKPVASAASDSTLLVDSWSIEWGTSLDEDWTGGFTGDGVGLCDCSSDEESTAVGKVPGDREPWRGRTLYLPSTIEEPRRTSRLARMAI